MAKGRRLTTSISERYLGGSHSYGDNQWNGTPAEVSEFGEEDVWSVVDHDEDNGDDDLHSHGSFSTSAWNSRPEPESNGSARTAKRDHHHRRRQLRNPGGLSLAFEDSSGSTVASPRIVQHQFRAQHQQDGGPRNHQHHHHHRRQMATSAPVNVPDWNKILRVGSVESFHDSEDYDGSDDNLGSVRDYPPHEYLARSRNTAATSVFEGVGRTLKGRDLSRLRDTVWSQTGFDG